MSKRLSAMSYICASGFFLLAGYEFIRSSSNTLFQAVYGVEGLPSAMVFIPIAILATVYVYNQILSWCGPRRTLLYTSIGSAAILALSTVGIWHGIGFSAAVLYVFREVYIVLIVEQYWSFVNSTFDEKTARRFNGVFTGCGSAGAVVGGLALHRLVGTLGTKSMPFFGAALVLAAAIFSHLAIARGGEPQPTRTEVRHGDKWFGLSTLAANPLLIGLFLLVVTTQVFSTVAMLGFQTELHHAFPDMDAQTAFSGKFYAVLNMASFVLQFLATPFVLARLRPILVQTAIPMLHLVTGFAAFLHPTLYTTGVCFLVFKAVDYSLFRASKEILYMPLSFDARYRAKELIDVFGYRFSKGATSAGIVAIQKAGLFTSSLYGGLTVVASAGWLVLVTVLLRRRTARRAAASPSAAS